MAYDGSLVFDTKMDTTGFSEGANGLTNLVKGLGVFELLKQGFQMISSSIDTAMTRIDTMEQFGRVMDTMTGSAQLTAQALEKTTDIVTGTAYGLNVAARSVQDFVSRGMEVDKATETVERFGDAVAFYGDGTNATFASVTDALSKMQTKGNVTMEHMEMLFTAGIPAIEIYADAVGMSTAEVTDAMSKGTLKSADFIEVMNSALEKGTSKFPALVGAAKEAGASWSGTFDNMQAAITRGVQSIISAVDDTLKSVGKLDMRGMVAKFGKDFEKGLKIAAKAVVPLIENLDLIGPAIGSVAASLTLCQLATTKVKISTGAVVPILKAAKFQFGEAGAAVSLLAAGESASAIAATGLTTGQSLLAAVTGVLTGKIGLASAAQLVWNTVMAANPVLLIVAGVAAATVAIVALSKTFEENETAMEYWTARTQDTTNALEAQQQKTEDLRKSREESAAAELAQIDNTQRLAVELQSLADENGYVQETDRARANFIMGQLNTAYGTELTMTEGLISNYQEWRGEISKLSEAKRAAAMISFWDAEYNNAVNNIPEMQDAVSEYRVNLDSIQGELDALIAGNSEAYSIWKQLTESGITDVLSVCTDGQRAQLELFLGQYNNLSDALSSQNALYNDAYIQLENYYETRAAVEQAGTEMAAGNYTAVQEILSNTTSLYTQEVTSLQQTELEKTQALAQSYAERLSAYAQYAEELKNQEAGHSAEELDSIRADAEKAQAAYMAAGGAKVDAQIQGIDGKTLDLQASFDRLSSAGIECINNSLAPYAAAGAQVPQAAASGIQDSTAVQSASSQMIEGGKATADAAVASGGFAESGMQIAQQTAEGMQTSTALADASFQMLTDTKTNAGATIAQSNFNENGQTIVKNTADGIKSGNDTVVAMESIIAATKSAAVAQAAVSNFPAIGLQMINGITAGVNAGKSGLISAMEGAVSAAAGAAKKAADIRSPSHLFENEVGLMIMRGWANGIEKGTSMIVGKITHALETAQKAVTGKSLLASFDPQAEYFTNAQLAAKFEAAAAYNQSRIAASRTSSIYNTSYAAASPTYIDKSIKVGDIISPDPMTPSGVSRSIEDMVAFYDSNWRIP